MRELARSCAKALKWPQLFPRVNHTNQINQCFSSNKCILDSFRENLRSIIHYAIMLT